MVYDNSRNRTVAEESGRTAGGFAWSLTAFYVMSARSLGITVHFMRRSTPTTGAKVGSFVQFESGTWRPWRPCRPTTAHGGRLHSRKCASAPRHHVVAILPSRASWPCTAATWRWALTVADLALAKGQTEKSRSRSVQRGLECVLGVVQRAMGDTAAAEASLRKA